MRPDHLTKLLAGYRAGDRRCLDQVFSIAYHELHLLAQQRLRHEGPDASLQASSLVNEAYCRLARDEHLRIADRNEFFAIASNVMRRILVDSARARHAAKRGGKAERVVLDSLIAEQLCSNVDVVALDEAMDALEEAHPRPARVVEMRYFGGFEIDDIASVLGTSPATVKRDWAFARAWLHREMTTGHPV